MKGHQSKVHITKGSTSIKLDPGSHPSKDLYVIGITGTSGKTSVSYLIGEVLKSAGYKPFILGALNSGNKDLSTPESVDIVKQMREYLEQGGTHFIMEVSSEQIDQDRILNIDFNIKLLTNITEDHLDYQKTFATYQQTKLGFMRDGTAHTIYPQHFKKEPIYFTTKLLGHFNLLNIKAAMNILRHINISEKIIQETLSSCSPPRGCLEAVDAGQAFTVLVDYAHTPDSLDNVLKTLKNIALNQQGRLLVLLGCSGNRDPGQRAKMGKIAGNIADFLVITEDNCSMEDSQLIMGEIKSGIGSNFDHYVMIQNRAKAIEFIINDAQDNDVVLLAGKEHEIYQVLKPEMIHFDDREVACTAILNELKPGMEAILPEFYKKYTSGSSNV
ncbi:hypothetical protein AU255_10275 [Methyloprofundus sedimenti]|uniref:UDP-N-acetylmuramoyl-L-alanyl-D-glutamate--2, 6-diaminopimelate ligase n=1 Tax=Methyloprofundus sedimenti TaxID=1420851 RepID=A0A1V8M9J0_9GAMM|nr:UDP-N-acetylmuramoyl-L-alanyl-D-glutamate--2,6-diaminopimelate ligase [Methyloprofundus sedimenti]OQK18197.1 hypothetical protein AU255_10275 [Methyloprofundus sedimenti]